MASSWHASQNQFWYLMLRDSHFCYRDHWSNNIWQWKTHIDGYIQFEFKRWSKW